MSPRELELRKRFRDEYGPASDLFFQRIADVGFTDKELWAVPALFLPGCGNLYAQSLVKVAIVGEGTNYWKDSLLTDLDARKNGKYELEFSFEVLQRESCERKGHLADGPTKWKNPFWKAVAEVLNTVYSTHDALDEASPIFRGIAWSNSYPIEKYKPDGVGGGVARDAITPSRLSLIQRIADECGLSSFDRFIRVFRPNVIIYTLHNSSGANRVFPKGIEMVEPVIHPKDGSPWLIKVYRYGRTLIVQTQHPSWVTGRKHIGVEMFGRAIADVLIRHRMFAPPAKEKFYDDSRDESFKAFSKLLNDEANRLLAGGCSVDNREMSYQLMLALADHLCVMNSTMTAVLMAELLNTVEKFRRDNWLYSTERRGPCAVAAGAWRYYTNSMKDEKSAAKIAEAFTKLDGRYAYC